MLVAIQNLLKSFGLQSISIWVDLFSVLLSCRKFGPMGKSLYNESGQCCINGLFGLVVCLPPHIGCRTGSGMWRSLWCCMSKGIEAGQIWIVRSCGSHHVFHHHQLIWGGFEVLADSYCSNWSFGVCLCSFACSRRVVVLHRWIIGWRFGLCSSFWLIGLSSFGSLTNLNFWSAFG